MKNWILFISITFPALLFAQTGTLSGTVSTERGPMELIHVSITNGNQIQHTTTNVEGTYVFNNIPYGEYTISASLIGYTNYSSKVQVQGAATQLNFTMQQDLLKLSQVVVTGTRNEIPLYQSPIMVNQIGQRTFESSQSLSMSEGLNFSPGLRVETNCQNCGFTQLRMNGLEGAYSQILINSRPVFSALSGVYALEMIPTNMIDRIEVVKGGGSVLFGGNAIAGTVNIITKDPVSNSFELGVNQSLIDGEASDRTLTFNSSIVTSNLQKGISFYGFNRKRDYWDANDDGFSEITKLENTTIGFDAFWKVTDRSKIKLNGYHISEYRRGGNKFELQPHQTDITEELSHSIYGAGTSLERVSKNEKHRFSVYGTFQTTIRNSYYGGGGRVLQLGDTITADDELALNAYGKSDDIAAIGGLLYSFAIKPSITLTTGSEYQYANVSDRMLGYNRSIDQTVGTIGTYAQVEWDVTSKLSLVTGGRFDVVHIDGSYDLEQESLLNDEKLNVLVPRISAMYKLTSTWKARASYAQGYRAPQAFDEDLHIETVGGAALFTRLDPDLITEKSHSYTASLNYTKSNNKWQKNVVIEGFYTYLKDPFILSDQQELPNGIGVITKRNGDGLSVQGINLEANLAYTSKYILSAGATFQTTAYDSDEEIWSPEQGDSTPATVTDELLRTPAIYGFYTFTYQPASAWEFSTTGVYTGAMNVPHVINPESEYTIIEETPDFFELNLKASYSIYFKDNYRIEFFAGIQNILNNYQKDFDLGADRDASYIYGPSRPITYFGGLKFGLN